MAMRDMMVDELNAKAELESFVEEYIRDRKAAIDKIWLNHDDYPRILRHIKRVVVNVEDGRISVAGDEEQKAYRKFISQVYGDGIASPWLAETVRVMSENYTFSDMCKGVLRMKGFDPSQVCVPAVDTVEAMPDAQQELATEDAPPDESLQATSLDVNASTSEGHSSNQISNAQSQAQLQLTASIENMSARMEEISNAQSQAQLQLTASIENMSARMEEISNAQLQAQVEFTASIENMSASIKKMSARMEEISNAQLQQAQAELTASIENMSAWTENMSARLRRCQPS